MPRPISRHHTACAPALQNRRRRLLGQAAGLPWHVGRRHFIHVPNRRHRRDQTCFWKEIESTTPHYLRTRCGIHIATLIGRGNAHTNGPDASDHLTAKRDFPSAKSALRDKATVRRYCEIEVQTRRRSIELRPLRQVASGVDASVSCTTISCCHELKARSFALSSCSHNLRAIRGSH